MTRYDDEEFLRVLDFTAMVSDRWVDTWTIAELVGCGWQTVNRRMLDLALEAEIQVYDPDVGDGEEVDPETVDLPTERILGYRRPPVDPETAPDELVTWSGVMM